MKIRLDFVTNSSSSSFVYIKFTNENIIKQLKDSGLNEFSVHEDDDFNNRSTTELQDFFENYLKSIDVVSCVTRYMRDKQGINITRDDFIQYDGEDGYGEANYGYPEEYGVVFDGFTELTVVLDEEFDKEEYGKVDTGDYKYDEDDYYIEPGWVDLFRKNVIFGNCNIEFHSDGDLIEGALANSDIIRRRISNFKSRYGTECNGYMQLVKAYIRELLNQGRVIEEIEEILKGYAAQDIIRTLAK
jgi:hypothetical protein